MNLRPDPASAAPRRAADRFRLGAGVLALALAALVAACGGKTEEELWADAQQRHMEQDFLAAILLYQDFVEKFPDSERALEARFRLAECYNHDRNFEKSRATLDEIVESVGGPDTERGLNAVVLKIQSYLAEKKSEEALDLAMKTSDTLKTVAPQYKQHLSMWVTRILTSMQRFDEAIPIYQAILEQPSYDNSHVEAVARQGMIRIFQKDIPGAIAVYEKYLETHADSPYEPMFCVDLSRLYGPGGMNDQAKADEYFERAKALVTKKVEAAEGAEAKTMATFELAEVLESRGLMAESQALFRGIVDEFPMGRMRGQAMIRLAESQRRAGGFDDALATLDRVVKSYPGTGEAVLAYQLAQQMQQDRNRARETTDTATLAGPTTDTATSAEPSTDTAGEAPAPEAEASEPAASDAAAQ